MKKIFIVFAVAAASYACGGGESEKSAPISNSSESNQNAPVSDGKSAETAKADAPAATADAGNGKSLIEASDCRTCHQDNAKVIGPSYVDVAKKYSESDVQMLAEKIIKGGKGNWGEIPMTAHPNVSQADAEAMVKYILSMNK